MTTICWTVVHHAAAPVAHGAANIAHITRRLIGPALRRAAQPAHHGPVAATHPRVWVELICKVVPAAVAGGGLLIPHPADLPIPPEPPAIIQPAPPRAPWGWHIPPTVAPEPAVWPAPGTGVIEPSTAPLLVTALGGLVLIRLAVRHGRTPGGS